MILHHNLLNAFLIPFPLTFSSRHPPSHRIRMILFFLLSQAIFKLQFEINVIEKVSQANIQKQQLFTTRQTQANCLRVIWSFVRREKRLDTVFSCPKSQSPLYSHYLWLLFSLIRVMCLLLVSGGQLFGLEGIQFVIESIGGSFNLFLSQKTRTKLFLEPRKLYFEILFSIGFHRFFGLSLGNRVNVPVFGQSKKGLGFISQEFMIFTLFCILVLWTNRNSFGILG